MVIGLIAGIYQYIQVFQTEIAGAYTASKPAMGHSWTEMECTNGICVTADNKVGIGTDSPTEKLQVTGNLKVSGVITGTGDVCNGTGNCLSALATLTNACGAAATTYVYSATAYSGAYCAMGTSTPASPAWPALGASTTWTCPVTSGSPISCTATHAATPVNGVCGPAHTTYTALDTAYAGTYCTTGTASGSPAFPAVGASSNWSCAGTGGGSSPSCLATRSNPVALVNSVHTNVNCAAVGGTVVGSGQSGDQCRFNATVCPSGWTQFREWSTLAPVADQSVGTCRCWYGGGIDWIYGSGPVNGVEARAWADATNDASGPSISACTVYPYNHVTYCCTCTPLLSPTKTQIGCY